MVLYITIAETLGTDGEFSSEVYPSTSAQTAEEICASLIAEMIEIMDLDRNIDPTATTELKGDGWFYRVRWERYMVNDTPKSYAVDIDQDTDGDETICLPTIVEIPNTIDEDEVADFLSYEYGYCVFGFNIVKNRI